MKRVLFWQGEGIPMVVNRTTYLLVLLLLWGCGPKAVKPPIITQESPNITIMTFNVKWLVDSEALVKRLKSKRIWGLEDRDEEQCLQPLMFGTDEEPDQLIKEIPV